MGMVIMSIGNSVDTDEKLPSTQTTKVNSCNSDSSISIVDTISNNNNNNNGNNNKNKNPTTRINLQIDIPTEKSILFALLINVCKIGESNALKMSSKLAKSNYQTVLFVTIIINGMVTFLLVNFDGLLLFLQTLQLVLIFVVFLDCNVELLYFRKKSFTLYWKLYNIVLLYISIFYLRYRYNLGQFNNEYYSTQVGIIYCVILILYTSIVIIIVALYHGFSPKIQKFVTIVTLIIVLYVVYQSLLHYFDSSLDYQRYFLGNMFSVRSIVISSGCDVALWLMYQMYQIIKYPNTMLLTSKIEINWV